MFHLALTGKPRNFEEVAPENQTAVAACFILDEELFKDGVKSVRSWCVWVKKHQIPWVQKKIGTGQYKVIVFADDFAASLSFAGELRLMDIQSL